MRYAITITILIGLGFTACVEALDEGRPPVASLSAPLCVVQGTPVKLDASASLDPDGTIERYVFRIDHQLPPFITPDPHLKYEFNDVIKKGGKYYPYSLNLTVFDDDGLRGSLEEPVYMYVLPTAEDCIANGMEPWTYEYTPGPPKDTSPQPDVIAPQDTEPAEDVVPMDTPQPETAPEDTIITSDLQPTDTGIPTECPNVAGPYRVEVFHQGQLLLDLELELQQVGCAVTEANGIVEGTVNEDGLLHLTSPFEDLYITDCSGVVDDTSYFELDCGDDWFATYTLNN